LKLLERIVGNLPDNFLLLHPSFSTIPNGLLFKDRLTSISISLASEISLGQEKYLTIFPHMKSLKTPGNCVKRFLKNLKMVFGSNTIYNVNKCLIISF